MSNLSDLEHEFLAEPKGEGSLSIYVTHDDQNEYMGYDLHPEDIGAMYFDGIGVPRWESLKADTVEEQTALYWEKFNERMENYPLIGRTRDTDEKVEYSADEVLKLLEECQSVASSSTDEKAQRALQKVSIAANRAAAKNAGLELKPSSNAGFLGGF